MSTTQDNIIGPDEDPIKKLKYTPDGIPIIYEPDKHKHLSKEQTKVLPNLILDCRTYNFNFEESMVYIQKRIGQFVSRKAYTTAREKLDSGIVTDEWLRSFARVGFALVHQELLQTALDSYHDTKRRILRLQSMDKQQKSYLEHFKFWEQIEIELKRLMMEQGKEVLQYTLGTPVIAQIRSMVRSEIILRERQKMIDSGMDTETADYEILKNVIQLDITKRKLHISEIDKTNITNSDEITKESTAKLLSDPEGASNVRQEFESNGQTTDKSEHGINTESIGSIQSTEGDTNYGVPTPDEAKTQLDRINKAKRDFIQ